MASWRVKGSRGPLLGGIALRFVTWWQVRDLDRRLAEGADPLESDELALRMGQLGSEGKRIRLSRALKRAVATATGEHRPLGWTTLRLEEIEANKELVLALSERLRSAEPLGVRGLAMAACLVDDQTSPLYRAGPDGALAAKLFDVLQELDRGYRTAGRAGL